MKTLVKYYMLPLLLIIVFSMPAAAQQKSPSDTYQQAQTEMKSEQKKEKKKRKKERKLEKEAGGNVNDNAQHGWLFKKKRKKKIENKESKH
jgi:hypothetical protein